MWRVKSKNDSSWLCRGSSQKLYRSKRGPSNHKAFLTKEGKKIIQDRKKDFQFILLIKEPDAYVFTSEVKHYRKLRRESITKGVNKIMRSVSKQLLEQPNITIDMRRNTYTYCFERNYNFVWDYFYVFFTWIWLSIY